MSVVTIQGTAIEGRYTLSVNGTEMLNFQHHRNNGLATMLRLAAQAVESDRMSQLIAIDEGCAESAHHVPVVGAFW